MNEFVDHTCLRPNATIDDIIDLCKEANKYNFRAVCVAPTYAYVARKHYKGIIVTVVGFPTGAYITDVKIEEARRAIEYGATEFDVVWDLGAFKSNRLLYTMGSLSYIVKEVAPIKVKVIVEEYYLNKEEKETAWKIVRDSGAWGIKTSTGFAPYGATISTVKQWKALGDDLKIKAAGGIRTLNQVKSFIDAGADIIGTSHGVQIHANSKLY